MFVTHISKKIYTPIGSIVDFLDLGETWFLPRGQRIEYC